MTGALRRTGIVFKLVVVPVALVLVLYNALDSSPPVDHVSASGWYLVAALLINQVALFAFAERFRASMLAVRFPLARLAAIRIHLQSVFYFFVLPMTVGMEISRLAKLAALNPGFPKANMAVALLLDRAAGVAVATLGAVLCLPLVSIDTLAISTPAASSLFIGTLAVAGGCLGLWLFRERIRAILTAVHWPALWAVALWSLPTHFLICFATWSIGQFFLAELSVVPVLFVVSASNLLMGIPVSFAGAGLAEAGGTGLWMLAGQPLEAALLLAFIPYALRLMAAFQGAIWEMLSGVVHLFEPAERL